MTEHVHKAECNKIAVFRYREDGVQRIWPVGASCKDTDEDLRAHFARWRPGAELLTITVEPAHGPRPEYSTSDLEGLTRAEVEKRRGKPREAVQTDKRGLWVYYYDDIEVYFDAQDVAEWTFTNEPGEPR